MSVSELINSINAATGKASELNEEDRGKLLRACGKLQSSLEGPRDKLMRIIFSSLEPLALRLAVDMEIFDTAATLSAAGKEIRAEDLVVPKDADTLLVVRVMRLLVGMGFFVETNGETYVPTPLASAFVTSSPYSQAIIHFTTQNEVVTSLPTYFAKTGYKNPNDAFNGPFQFARQTELHCFDWIATQPRLQNAFNTVMTIPRNIGRTAWYKYFPVPEKLVAASPTDPLIIDIGGGIGHDLIRFKEANPEIQGRLIVQDIPVVISGIAPGSLPEGIEAQPHDFFKPQPIQNAKAYFLANVLHDWPDKQASIILEQIRDAMAEDSMLLINENLMKEENASFESACTDWTMMGGFSALERTERQFKELIESVGLVLVKVWGARNVENGPWEGRRLLEVKKG
ncbi:c509615c-dff0-4986-9b94-02827227728b [Sclerotinia trifoliorum]|uniref:C509615c-dff0-4986-9b94-02827227728b n=1 Tax=Sclerotinia trifoliorum TaxID=28548 RepID=A0A8H2VSG7_9HELO|nr:c509615c-dff0-4986-9b94-02827227728b [Sclerotinia trifoliorum]